MKLYKMLNEDGSTPQGCGNWDLDGGWMPTIEGELSLNVRGYHILRKEDIIYWMGVVLWKVEVKNQSEIVTSDTKVVVRQARLVEKVETWNHKTIINFSCDCAEHVLLNFVKQFPNDNRPHAAIQTARLYSQGGISLEKLKSVVRAAESAARAAEPATRAAVWAKSAARAAVWAESAAESERQTNKILEYLKL